MTPGLTAAGVWLFAVVRLLLLGEATLSGFLGHEAATLLPFNGLLNRDRAELAPLPLEVIGREVEMAWLLRQGEVLASLELASSPSGGRRAMSGVDRPAAVLVRPSRSAHSLGVRKPLDVAYLDQDLTVLALVRISPYRVAWPRRGTAAVLQAEAGAFDRWGLRLGDCLEIKD